MITITGGKLTTWRRMAKMTVDRIVERDGARRALPHARDPARAGGRAPTSCRASRACPTDAYAQLAGRYGHAAHDVLARRRRARRAGAADRARACPTCSPRRVYAARREQARSVGDVLLRRTRLGPAGRARGLGRGDEARSASRARWRRSSAGTTSAAAREARAFRDEAAAEGIAAGSRAGA